MYFSKKLRTRMDTYQKKTKSSALTLLLWNYFLSSRVGPVVHFYNKTLKKKFMFTFLRMLTFPILTFVTDDSLLPFLFGNRPHCRLFSTRHKRSNLHSPVFLSNPISFSRIMCRGFLLGTRYECCCVRCCM